eukprot:TRINITY_DN15930_c0_g1_i1.p1 TRINITY_DN15930_c0_g1~~TRINITY_DN15930_c0_g1_i1.p1  ORF type:complete len:313 (+),score=70.00 TRINITY_DN15930_c0_g1_i1:23-940(+)
MEEKPVSGIIYPPPEIRVIIDKTAVFVAKNGKEFEVRIKANEKTNPRFKFLDGDSPYSAYYEMKIEEARRKIIEHQQQALTQGFEMAEQREATPEPAPREATPASEMGDSFQTKEKQRPIPKENPCAPIYSVPIPDDIGPLDLDIIKLTAQYVARNGQSFLSNITGREHRNVQFDFLKGTHRWFQFFRGLVDAYTKILIPPKDMVEKLRQDIGDKLHVLDRCQQAADWTTAQEKEKRETEEAIEAERVAFQLIDWHDFVIVETIDFKDDIDELPAAPPQAAQSSNQNTTEMEEDAESAAKRPRTE